MNGWEKHKDGLAAVYIKGNLRVRWDLVARKYTVERDGAVVEKGRAPHLPEETFLHYIELTWSKEERA